MARLRLVAVSLFTTVFCFFARPVLCEITPLKDGDGMESRVFRSAVDTKGHFTVDSTPILPHMAISLGLVLDFGFNNWIAVEQIGVNDEIYDHTLVENYIGSVLMFNLGLRDMFVLGIQIPIGLTSGLEANYVDKLNTWNSMGWSTRGGIGDIGLHAKMRWIRADRHPIGLGTIIQYQLPVGKPELLMGEPKSAVSAKVIFDVEPISWYRLALNVGARYAFGASDLNRPNTKKFDLDPGRPPTLPPEQADEDDTRPMDADTWRGADVNLFEYGPLLTFGLGQSFSFWPEVMDFVVEVYGNQMMTQFSNTAYLSVEASAGFKLYVERNSYLLAGYAHGLPLADTPSNYGFQNMEHRFFIGFAYEPSIGDRDGDGIKDDLDKCPDDPEDMDDFEDVDGCPEPDNDRDGILDVHDDCPLVPEDRDNDDDEDGCPERGDNDRDGDGIIDDEDQCPDDPEDLDQFEDEDGCPDPDNDKDQILDVNDMCPNDPEDRDGFEDQNGCPDPDNDKDRILDVDDKCPLEPETYNGKDDEDGCPDQGDVVLTDTDIKILKKVYFEYDSAVIKEVSYPILNAVAATIMNNPQIDTILIQGHADERGEDRYNLRLTNDRAAAVLTYLMKRGVKRDKLSSQGYGEYCPVDEGHNESAWEKNRRVEFKVLSVDGTPTGVDTACDRARAAGIDPQ